MLRLIPTFVLCCVAAATEAQVRDPGPAPGKLLDVGGRHLHVICTGERPVGAPAVVLEAGASSFAIDWTLVQREVARSNRVCAYDRAGMGWSDSATATTRRSAARDLHDLLRANSEAPPYVLVGASRGGLLVRSYLADYPDEVAGFVFVDPTTEDRLFGMVGGEAKLIAEFTPEELKSTLPRDSVHVPRRSPQTGAPFDKLPSDLYQTRILLDERLIASTPNRVSAEAVAAFQQGEHATLVRLLATRSASTHPLGERPTVVLTRGDEHNPGREQVHAALAKLSRNSRHCVIGGAGHEIHLFEPGAVIRAVGDVVTAIRQRSAVAPGC